VATEQSDNFLLLVDGVWMRMVNELGLTVSQVVAKFTSTYWIETEFQGEQVYVKGDRISQVKYENQNVAF
jgi:hypothetical protein